ncbi:MAG: STAS domain-containing protein [Acidiferrobacterales bacterium]|nr:STAS domain-containing protein [Acidiferrobacterales bacterium]
MSAKVETSVGDDVVQISVSGELRLNTVAAVNRSVNLSSFGQRHIDIELGAVTDADSAGLALCVEWLAQARDNHATVEFTNVPDVLSRIARVNKLDDIYRASTNPMSTTD